MKQQALEECLSKLCDAVEEAVSNVDKQLRCVIHEWYEDGYTGIDNDDLEVIKDHVAKARALMTRKTKEMKDEK